MRKNEIHVFLDTMIFMHYKSIAEIDLPAIFDSDHVIIVIPRITIQELDKHKNIHTSHKIRQRVKTRLDDLSNWILKVNCEIRPNVFIKYDANRPSIDYEAAGLDPYWSDDQLLAHILQYRSKNALTDILLVTDDTGPKLTAHHLNIETTQLPEKFRLPPEEDELQKENRHLKNELLKLQSSAPQLVLRFEDMEDEEDHKKFNLAYVNPNDLIDKGQIIATLRSKHQPKQAPVKTNSLDIIMLIAERIAGNIPESEYQRYNQGLENYFTQYTKYLDELEKFKILNGQKIMLHLEVRNIGTTPAEDVDLYVYFPDGFALYTDSGFPKEPKEPVLPQPPMSALQQQMAYASQRFDTGLLRDYTYNMPHTINSTFSLKKQIAMK